MAAPRDCGSSDRATCASPDLGPEASTSDPFLGTPLDLHREVTDTPRAAVQTLQMDAELRSLLHSLPTKSDITTLIGAVEAAHRKEIALVREEVKALATRVTGGETSLMALEGRVAALEEVRNAQAEALMVQQLRLEEIEDRSRRNNLRLRGLPAATGPEDLADTEAAIFRNIPGVDLPPRLEFDRVHRALGPRSADPARPRDVVCRLHHYLHKEEVLRKSWEAPAIEFDGVELKILPDISRATLQRRALLKPLLELA